MKGFGPLWTVLRPDGSMHCPGVLSTTFDWGPNIKRTRAEAIKEAVERSGWNGATCDDSATAR